MIIWELPNMESGIFLDPNHEDKHLKRKFGNILAGHWTGSTSLSLFYQTSKFVQNIPLLSDVYSFYDF